MTETCDIRYTFTITNDIRMSLCISISLASKTIDAKYPAYHEILKHANYQLINLLTNRKTIC